MMLYLPVLYYCIIPGTESCLYRRTTRKSCTVQVQHRVRIAYRIMAKLAFPCVVYGWYYSMRRASLQHRHSIIITCITQYSSTVQAGFQN